MRALIVFSGIVLGFVLSILFGVFIENGTRHQDATTPLENKYYLLSVRLMKRFNPAAAAD
jgi:hypothetical protein